MDFDSLTRLQGLQADLTAFSESRLPNLERLWTELEESVESFRQLLDHKPKSDKSRKDLFNDNNTIKIEDVEYSINDDFRREVIQVADELDLDELESAHLLLVAQQSENTELSRSLTLSAIAHYHGNREALLSALRLVFDLALDDEIDEEHRDAFLRVVRYLTDAKTNRPANQSFWGQCQKSMESMESWVKRLLDRLASISVIGETRDSVAVEALEYQKSSLLRQHESGASILSSFIKLGHASLSDYESLVKKAATLTTFDEIMIHYCPLLIAFPICAGSEAGFCTLRDARRFDQIFTDKTTVTGWARPEFRAAATVWWLAEYSGRYADGYTGSPIPGVDLEKEGDARSDRVMSALRNGAFQFMLLVCSKIRPQLWHDPAKTALINYLLGTLQVEHNAPVYVSEYFAHLMLDKLQIFIEALISNMPDTIRRLKYEEDDQRRNIGPSLTQIQMDQSLHLERFLTIISYAFQHSPDQAHEAFWADADGNMYGFLQWASKRQSTPRAAAFCEMFQAIAENSECAESAHKFLVEEAIGVSGAKLRRGVSLSWAQIFAELSFYATRLRDTPNLLSGAQESGIIAQTFEPESALMLECYLRLTSHMCRNSPSARAFLLSHPDFNLQEVLFDLCRSNIESRFKACAFNTLTSVLMDKSIETSYGMWDALDAWICNIPTKGGVPKTTSTQPVSENIMTTRLRPIANAFEEPNAFVRFLQTLIDLPIDQQALNDALPFSEQLGANYRMTGIDQYVDFVFSMVMTGVLPQLDDQQHKWELRCACLDFILVSLSTFNEDLVIFANTTSINVDTAMSTSNLATYIKLHPFARVMEWMFNDAVITQLFEASHASPDALTNAAADSPMATAVARAIQVIDIVMRLQATYFDIVRPLVKTQAVARSRPVANPTLASFDDAILANISLVVDLGLYCSTAFEHLTTLSLALLQRLALSRKLSGAAGGLGTGRNHTSRILAALQQTTDVDRISLSFIGPLQIGPREIEAGPEAPGFTIKVAILDLLNKSLGVSPSRPVLAHCLLGFTCTDQVIEIPSEGLFSRGESLFHAIVRLYAETASPEQALEFPWFNAVRSKASEIIRKLVASPLTSEIILSELRESGFNETIAISQQPLASTGLMEEVARNPDFLISEFAPVFRDTLLERAAYFERESLELRSAELSQSLSLQAKTRSTLLGMSTLSSGEQVQHANLFDLFDFFDEGNTTLPPLSLPTLMADLDFTICKTGSVDEAYDLRLVRELLLLREAELRKTGLLNDEAVLSQCQTTAEGVLIHLTAENQLSSNKDAQRAAAKAWVQLVTVMLSSAGLEGVQRSAFTLQALQVVLPKIEIGLARDSGHTLPLVKLVYALVRINTKAGTPTSEADAVPQDILLAAFHTALNCVTSCTESPELREAAYQIVSHLLSSTSPASVLYRNARKMIEAAGERLLDFATEDALLGSPSSKVSALLMLNAFIEISLAQKSQYIVRALSRLNFIAALVDAIRSLPVTLEGQRSKAELERTMVHLQTTLNALLCLARDSRGADALLEAGLFGAIRESGLLAADPDLGDVDGEEVALARYYGLLASVLRIVNAVLLVKGKKNQNMMAAGRTLVVEARPCLIAALKASRKGSQLGKETRAVLSEVVDGFQVLLWGTDFLEFDESPTTARKTSMAFT